MKSFLKKILPSWVRDIILKIIILPSILLTPAFKNNRLFAIMYYSLFSNKFGRENKAVLAGKVEYQKNLKEIGETSVLLRRNIHRLEKGLIMQPRRDVFAERFIGETIQVYERAISLGSLNAEELKWATDVLTEYFNIVKVTKQISKARQVFNSVLIQSKEDKKYIPYPFESLPDTEIKYEELKKLFLKRRSVRWYQDKDVPSELIEEAVNIAVLAPSACNRQPYSFYVSDNRNSAVQIAKCAGGTPGWVDNIPCTIAIVGDLSAYPNERDRHLIYIDGSLAAMQLMLAFETLGLSSCSINWPDIESAERKIDKLLDLKSYQRPIMLLSVGYAQDKGGIPYSQKKSAKELIKRV